MYKISHPLTSYLLNSSNGFQSVVIGLSNFILSPEDDRSRVVGDVRDFDKDLRVEKLGHGCWVQLLVISYNKSS